MPDITMAETPETELCECSGCSEQFEPTRLNEFEHCPDCAVHCASCAEPVASDSDLDEANHCSSCHRECFGCGMTFHESDFESEQGYCEGCCCFCSVCDEEVSDSPDGRDTGMCRYCREDREAEEEENRLLHEYDFAPELRFRLAKHERRLPDTMFLGVEVEMDHGGRPDREADLEDISAPDLWFAKKDGSLNHGIEMVSHPATWDFWASVDFSWTKRALARGYRAWDTKTCGQHVHVSRKAVSKLTLWKLLTFFSQNSEFLLRLSGRRREQVDRYAFFNAPQTNAWNEATGSWGERSFARDIRNYVTGGRYLAINWSNSATVEFRIWKGTLSPGGVLRHLALTRLLIIWARETSMRAIRGVNAVGVFLEWLDGNATMYVGSKVATSIKERIQKCA